MQDWGIGPEAEERCDNALSPYWLADGLDPSAGYNKF